MKCFVLTEGPSTSFVSCATIIRQLLCEPYERACASTRRSAAVCVDVIAYSNRVTTDSIVDVWGIAVSSFKKLHCRKTKQQF